MPPRLRDLISGLRKDDADPTELRSFAAALAAKNSRPDVAATPDVQQIKQDIVAQAASSLVAQATYNRTSVLGLLET